MTPTEEKLEAEAVAIHSNIGWRQKAEETWLYFLLYSKYEKAAILKLKKKKLWSWRRETIRRENYGYWKSMKVMKIPRTKKLKLYDRNCVDPEEKKPDWYSLFSAILQYSSENDLSDRAPENEMRREGYK